MPERCDICGIEALENEPFAEERLPFRRAKKYCPACHQRFYHRVHIILAVLLVVVAVLNIVVGRGDRNLMRWLPLICLLQWVLIIPHELGHALVARLWGYQQIRIFVGSGKPLFAANFLGFPWMFRMVPFGGVTVTKPGDKVHRLKYVAFVAAGPLVKLALGGVAWCLTGPEGLSERSLASLLCWANLLVLAENLI